MSSTDARAAAIPRALRTRGPILSLYIFRELLPPTFMGFALFTFFLLMHFLLRLAQMIINYGIGWADVGRLFLYNVPHVIVLTVPMAVLVGGLLAFGRLSADSEIIAMRSSGVSLYQLAAPILVLALAATLLNVYLFLEVLPWGNNAVVQLQWRLINSRTISSEIRPRVFETTFPSYTLFVEDIVGPERILTNLLLVRSDQSPPRVVMAETAATRYDEVQRALWMELRRGHIYEGGDTAEGSNVTAFAAADELVMTEGGMPVGELSKDERMMNLAELRETIRMSEAAGAPSAKYRVEAHKKFAIPFACLVMGLIAVPLGISTQRHTRATGYLVAIGVIAVYYQFIENGEKFAEEGVIPAWLGMWGGNLAIGCAALFLLWAKAREKDFGIVDRLTQLSDRVRDLWLTTWARVGGGETQDPNAEENAAALRARLGGRRFPRILDDLVLRQFARIFAMALGGLVVIWIIGEYFEISDDVYAAGAGRAVIWEYFKYQMPFILTMTIPIATLLTVLIVFSLMSKHNEVVAVLAGGTSLFRLAAPMLVPAVALTAAEYAIFDYIAPHTNIRVAEIRDNLSQNGAQPSFRPIQGYWARGNGRHLFNYADYDADQRVFQGLYVYFIDAEKWRLSRVDYAARLAWQDGAWAATDGWRRHYEYNENGSISSPPLMRFPTAVFAISEPPEYFGTDERQPEQMSFNELRGYITDLERRGFDAGKYRIDLQQKLSFPAVVFVLAIVGIPFGFRMGRQGTLSGAAVALGLTMLFWLLFVFFRAVGSAEILPAAIAAWAPHILFLALAGYITLGLRT